MRRYPIKVYTAFLFKDPKLSHLHCTHKYLGECTTREATIYIKLIGDYFDRRGGFSPFTLRFEGIDYFKPANVRVLKAYGAIQRYQDLRQMLGLIREDDFAEYVPHVTTDLDGPIESVFGSYALMSGKEVVWEFLPSQNSARTVSSKVTPSLFE